MANSRRQQILDYIVGTVLPLITTGNGYNFTLATKQRGLENLQSLTDADYPAVFLASADEARSNVTNASFRSDMTAFLHGYVKSPDGVSGLQVELDKLIEDLTSALWQVPNFGSIVRDMEIADVNTDVGDNQEHASFVMQVRLHYEIQGATP